MTEEIALERVCNKLSWGFRLTGGRDFGSPLTVSRIQAGSISEKGGLKVGDIITHIGTEKANELTHADAQRCIIESENSLKLTVLRGSCPDVQRALTPVRGLPTRLGLDTGKLFLQAPDTPFRNDTHRRAVSTISASSVCSLYEDDSFELLDQSEDEFTDEYHEPTEKEIDEMLLENAEVLEENGKSVIGVNFHRFIPKCEFIKDSAVFAVLQEEQVRKELSEREQLEKCPNKRFSTFLAPPDRPIPTPKRPPEKRKEQIPQCEVSECESVNATENQQCCRKETISCSTPTTESQNVPNKIDDHNAKNVDEDREKGESTQDAEDEQKPETKDQAAESSSENKVCIREVQDEDDDDTSSKTNSEKAVEFETQLKNIKNTLNTLGELPSLIQSQLQNIQTQINNLLKLKSEQDKKSKSDSTSEKRNVKDDQTEPVVEEYEDDEISEEDESTESYTDYEEPSNEENETNEEAPQNAAVKHDDEKDRQNDQKSQNEEKQIDEDLELRKRRICPLTPLPRPVVLPGGRIWRKPQDAYNEEFIAETLISQAEVLVGSTLGVNFRKYEPPKFDVSNSAVYKMIHNIESKKTGLENRDTVPALQDYYQSPINAKHFYLAKLADRVQPPKDSEKNNESQPSQ